MPKVIDPVHRLHGTYAIQTPFRGTLTDLRVPAAGSFIVLLLGVPPQEHRSGERLGIRVGGTLMAEHDLDWLMDFYRLNADLYDRGTNGALLHETLEQLALMSRRLLDDWSAATVTERGGALGEALQALAKGATAMQAIAGVRLARAVLVPPRARLEVHTDTPLRCYLGGLVGTPVDEEGARGELDLSGPSPARVED